jgi:hypothetical protein
MEELYTPARYMAAMYALGDLGESTVNDVDFYARPSKHSLKAELELLESIELIKEESGRYAPREEYEEGIQSVAEFVQVECNGRWEDIDISDEDLAEISEEGAEIINWII